MPLRWSNWSHLKVADNAWLRGGETICVAETYTVNSLPRFDGDPLNKNATDFKVQ